MEWEVFIFMPSDTHLGVLTKWLTKGKCSGIAYLARALNNERSKRMNTIQELQKLREELIREIDEKFDWIIDEVKKESVPSRQKESRKPRNYEIIYPLNVGAGIFKGKRPTGVIFADGRRTENPTWKSVAEELLKDCCKDSDQRQALMDLRGKVLGRNRVLLGSETGKMRSPVKIDEALYIETHIDAETLMRILTTRILDYGWLRLQQDSDRSQGGVKRRNMQMQLAMHMVTIEDLDAPGALPPKVGSSAGSVLRLRGNSPALQQKIRAPGHRPGGHREVSAGGFPVRHPVGAADRATRPDRHRPALVPGSRPLRPGAGSQHCLAAAPPETVLPQGVSAVI